MSFLSACASRMARSIYQPGHNYPVLFGELRGMRLRFEPFLNIREQVGLWERKNLSIIKRLAKAKLLQVGPDAVMYDVGANFGLYTLFFSRLIAGGRVYAFEPASEPRDLLVVNLRANNVSNVYIEPMACSDATGITTLFISGDQHTSSLRLERRSGDGLLRIEVPSTTLDDHWLRVRRDNDRLSFVKIDIEGAGDSALQHCIGIARSQRCFFLIESHSPAEDKAISELATGSEYTLYRTSNSEWVQNTSATHPELTGVWGTLLLVPNEILPAVRRIL